MLNITKIRSLIGVAIMLGPITSWSADPSLNQAIDKVQDPTEISAEHLISLDDYWMKKIFSNRYVRGYSNINNEFLVQEKQYTILLEVPGYDKDQIKIKLNNNRLIISGNNVKEEDKKDISKDYKYRGQSNFNFNFTINDDVNKDAISSNLKNGILTIILPRTEIKDKDIKEVAIN